MCKVLKFGSAMLVIAMLCNFLTTFSFCKERLYGDLNNDGGVNSVDFALLRGELLQTRPLSGDDWKNYADVTQDGAVNAIDFAILRQYLLGMINTLPVIPDTPEPTPTVNPQDEWIPYIPKPEEVKLSLVINQMTGRHIQADLKLVDGVYRITDGQLVSQISESGLDFTTSGVKIEKYVGSEKLSSNSNQIKYFFSNALGDKNHFTFKVYDTIVKDVYFSQNSIIDTTPILYGSTVNKNFVNGNTNFALNLMQKLNNEDSNKNMFFSPFSISMALSMVYQGAGTTTKECMAKALNYTGMSDEEINQSYVEHLKYFKALSSNVELNFSNSIWINEGYEVKDSFTSINDKIFNAKCSNLDFTNKSACDTMNKWISDSTKGMIDKMITPPIPENVEMFLMNAIYFNGSWANKFEASKTKDDIFTTITGDEKAVPMMNKTDSCLYTETSEFKAVKLPYTKGNISMSCILPKNDNINDFISKFNTEKLTAMNKNFSNVDKVILSIPRFKMEYAPQKLKETLIDAGMGEAFSNAADFSGISKNSLFIDNVKHKAVIDVNEEGTEAAAVTVISIATPSIEHEPKLPTTFIADKPFMFIIQDNQTGTILFMGKVADF
jgi:serpin B